MSSIPSRALACQAPSLIRRPDEAGAPPPEQVHVQFGGDAATQAAVSWAATAPAAKPRLRLGRPADGLGTEIGAQERSYTEALTRERVWTYHATLAGLAPDTRYAYQVCHDGAAPAGGTFMTAPAGRSGGFTFTSFGDQAIPAPIGLGLGPNSPNAGHVVSAIERINPLFHLVNGDLCYANISDQPVATWAAYFTNNARSATSRPWMPAAGNHESEVGNGPQGYLSYQTRFELPDNESARFRGNWYSFTAGSILVISLNNDDVCYQDGTFSTYRRDHVPGYAAGGLDPYINGYSDGEQRRWLERELARARQSAHIDWIVVCMHQVAMSSARLNGADLGIREQWLPLFDAYGVDLVLAGHDHHYERTFPVRGVEPSSALLTPAARGGDPDEMDTSQGTVHVIVGGGGSSSFFTQAPGDAPREGTVITGVGAGDPQRQRRPIVATEPASWSAYRDLRTPYGFVSCDFVPAEPGGTTSITVTYHGAAHGSADYIPLDRFVLRKDLRNRGEGEPSGKTNYAGARLAARRTPA